MWPVMLKQADQPLTGCTDHFRLPREDQEDMPRHQEAADVPDVFSGAVEIVPPGIGGLGGGLSTLGCLGLSQLSGWLTGFSVFCIP